MATAPVKPLHNFPLSLKWGTQTQPPYRPAPADSGSDSDPESHHQQSTTPPLLPPPPPPRVGSRSARLHRFSFNSCSTSSSFHKPNKSHKLPPSKRQVIPEKPKAEGEAEGEEEEENSFRPWKLRPRNKNGSHNNSNGAVSVEVKEPTPLVPVAPASEPKSMRLRGIAESSGGGGNGGGNGGVVLENKKEKRKVWIALSREEIEEDVFSMTGSRPARRPRKRPKNIQKLLDSVFPGLWLVGTTADSYRLAETPVRR